MIHIWTPELTDALLALMKSGFDGSCDEIAATLNRRFGASLSRKAVIAKRHRLRQSIRDAIPPRPRPQPLIRQRRVDHSSDCIDFKVYLRPTPQKVLQIVQSCGMDAAVERWGHMMSENAIAKLCQIARSEAGQTQRTFRRTTTPAQELDLIIATQRIGSVSRAATELGVSASLLGTLFRERQIPAPRATAEMKSQALRDYYQRKNEGSTGLPSDAEIYGDRIAGMTTAAMAARYGVSEQLVRSNLRRLSAAHVDLTSDEHERVAA